MTLQKQMQSLMLQLYRDGIHYDESVREFRKLFILTALEDNNYNQCRTAVALGLHRNTLSRQIAGLHITVKQLRKAGECRKPNERTVPAPIATPCIG